MILRFGPVLSPRVYRGSIPGIVMALIGAGVAWGLAGLSGAAGLPRGDDWAYSRAAFELARTGHVHLAGWGLMTLVGQLLWAGAWVRFLGAHVWVLDLSTTALLVAGVVAGHALARRVAGSRDAVAVVGGLLAAPGLIRDGAAFRTDVPALALGTVSLLMGVGAADMASGRRRRAAELGCVAFGLFAFAIRQTALAAPAAVLVVRLLDRRSRRTAVVDGVVLTACCLFLWSWRSGLADAQRPDGTPPLFVIVELLTASCFSFALLLLPVLAWTAPRWLRPRSVRARLTGAGIGLAAAGYPVVEARWSWSGRPVWLIGDYLDRTGIGGDKLALGRRSAVIPAPAWFALNAVAVACGIVLCALAVESLAVRRRAAAAPTMASRIFAVHLILIFSGLIAAAVTDGNLYDRYLWPAILPASLLLAVRERAAVVPAPRRYRCAGLIAATVMSLWLTACSDVFDAALWRAGVVAVRSGYPATTVDAGFAWTGAHTSGPVIANPSAVPPGRAWWTAMGGTGTVCIVVTASPRPGPGPAAEIGWGPLPLVGVTEVYLYRTGDASCPPEPVVLDGSDQHASFPSLDRPSR
jgi:hypothetical protein